MPEYECAVAKVHKRLYGLEQSTTPVCCGKPMTLVPSAPQAAALVHPATAVGGPQALLAPAAATVPQKEKSWWQHWN
jgi:hypothetical protein